MVLLDIAEWLLGCYMAVTMLFWVVDNVLLGGLYTDLGGVLKQLAATTL